LRQPVWFEALPLIRFYALALEFFSVSPWIDCPLSIILLI
jgi:hypothetical protein